MKLKITSTLPAPEPTEENTFVNYSTVKPEDNQNRVIDMSNQTDENINQGGDRKNWFERLITWLFN